MRLALQRPRVAGARSRAGRCFVSESLSTPSPQAAGTGSACCSASAVERWLNVLRSVSGPATPSQCTQQAAPQRQDLRLYLEELLISHPDALRLEPEHVASVAQVLYDATRQQRLYTQWWWPSEVLLDLAMAYGPAQLIQALGSLQRAADSSLDGMVSAGDLLAACAPHVQLLLAPGMHEQLRSKALLLRQLVPEFTPGTVMRAIPELLLSWQEWEIETGVVRAGDVVVLGQEQHLTAQLVLAPTAPEAAVPGPEALPALLHTQQTRSPLHTSAGALAASGATPPAPGSTRRVMRRRWDADSLAQRALPGSCVKLAISHARAHSAAAEQQRQRGSSGAMYGDGAAPSQHQAPAHPHTSLEGSKEQEDVLCMLTNSRQLIYVHNRLVEVRYQDPFRQEEALLAAGVPRGMAAHCYTPRAWLLWPIGMGANEPVSGSDCTPAGSANSSGSFSSTRRLHKSSTALSKAPAPPPPDQFSPITRRGTPASATKATSSQHPAAKGCMFEPVSR